MHYWQDGPTSLIWFTRKYSSAATRRALLDFVTLPVTITCWPTCLCRLTFPWEINPNVLPLLSVIVYSWLFALRARQPVMLTVVEAFRAGTASRQAASPSFAFRLKFCITSLLHQTEQIVG